jgi:hypothetical protein
MSKKNVDKSKQENVKMIEPRPAEGETLIGINENGFSLSSCDGNWFVHFYCRT